MNYAIIQARTGSTRLPNKIFMDLCGYPDIYHVYNRVKQSEKINKVIIATTSSIMDDQVEKFCETNNILCFRGSEQDVLDRFYKCGKRFGLVNSDRIIRITADCPFVDPDIIDILIDLFDKGNVDYVSNTHPSTFPDGLDVEVFGFEALSVAWNEAKLPSEREHVTPYIVNHPEKFRICNYDNSTDLSSLRWTLDEYEDYVMINKIYKALYEDGKIFKMSEILSYIEENPMISKINDKFIRNEGYLKSLQIDKE